jgi:uncharacterized protein
MKVLLTGSSGFIGSALRRRLAAEGHEVGCLLRHRLEMQPYWNVATGEIDLAAFGVPDAVIHLAGANVAERRWSESRKRELRSSRVEGTHLLASYFARQVQKPAHLLVASAIGVYGDRGDEKLDESSGVGKGFLATLGAEWEAAVSPATAAGIRTVLLRTGVVLAPQGGALKKMLPPFRAGLGGPLGSGRQFFSWISLQDELAAICFLLATPSLQGPVNLTAPHPVTNADFTAALAKQLHRPAKLPVPGFALRLLLGREMADELLLASSYVIPKKLVEAGFVFCHPHLTSALESMEL